MLKCFINFPAIQITVLNSVSIESIIWLLFQGKQGSHVFGTNQNHLDVVS